MSAEWKNEGEGSRTGAKAYDDAVKKFVDSGRVKEAAEEARDALQGPEAVALKRAEAVGQSHSKGEDGVGTAMRGAPNAGTVDFEAALVNPADHFGHPGDVVANRFLSQAQKARILKQWDLDARQLSVAEEENMAGGEESMVGRVSRALMALGETKEEGGDTKLG